MGLIKFNPDKYKDRIEYSQKLYDITSKFKEPERVPIHISVGGSFFCKLFGVNIRDFYTDMEVNIEVQAKGIIWCFEELKDDRVNFSIGMDLGPVYEGIVFDCPIEYPDDTSPWIVPILKKPADIEKLKVPEPSTSPKIQEIYKKYEKYKELAKKIAPDFPTNWGGVNIHPPLSAACAIMDPVLVYELMISEPEVITKLFDKLLKTFFLLRDFADEYFNIKRESIGLADDNSAFISNELYRKLVFKYNKAIYDKYGKKERSLHADGPNDHHFEMYANDMKLTSMDIGGFSSNEVAAKYLKGKTVIFGGLNCRDLYGSFEEAKPKVDSAIEILAPGGGYVFGVGGETYAGVNPNTLISVVEYAKEKGKYSAK
jgi:uroporphyrinogen-III decarboxylase